MINWAKAIATRIADEWSGNKDFPEDVEVLVEVLTKALSNSPNECKKLIGTGIIEENYFSRASKRQIFMKLKKFIQKLENLARKYGGDSEVIMADNIPVVTPIF